MTQKRILNVGCGNQTYGTDFIDLYPTRREVKRCNFDTDRFPYKSNTFDEVYSHTVFEHLTNPSNFLKESYRVLKRGGKIIIITDNAGLWGFFGGVHQGNYEKEHTDTPNDRHYSLFTPNHLKNFLVKYGFKIKSIRYVDLSNDLRIRLLVALNKKLSPNLEAVGIK